MDFIIEDSGECDAWHRLYVQNLYLTAEENALITSGRASGTVQTSRDILVCVVSQRYAEQVAAILLEMPPMMRSHAAEDPEYPRCLAELIESHKHIYGWRETNG